MSDNTRDLERSLDATRKGSPDAKQILTARLAWTVIREMERKVKEQKQEATR